MRLQGKLALVTGAASGIGRTGCELFVAEGARVVAVDRDAAALAALQSELAGRNGSLHAMPVDLGDPEACRSVVERAVALLGGLDLLWGNAGVVGPAGVENLDLAQYEDTMRVNLRPNFLLAAAAVAPMRARGGGAMLFTSSISGIVGSRKSPVYAATKHALVGLARSLALAHGGENIRVNAICPGLTETPMLPSAMGRGLDQAAMLKNRAEHVAAIPLRRVGAPLEIARAALWLLSDEASYVTGVALPVDGGFTCG